MFRRAFITLCMVAGGLVLSAGPAIAKDAPIYTGLFNKLAVSGYDTVAYFTEQKPVKGESRFTFAWAGAEWRFSSAENRDKFVAVPERYAPQYGGYCAWAVANGYTAKGDPLNWKIVGGKLYLNYNAETQSKWVKDVPGFIRKGDGNWPTVLGK